MTPSDRYTESSIDHYPVRELTEPQFCYNSPEEWDYPYLNVALIAPTISYSEFDHRENHFGYSLVPLDCERSIESDLTVRPEILLEFI
jgi:hypothetical protein